MANPINADVRLDERLTMISVAFTQDASDFIADKEFPQVPVEVQGGKYVVYDRADLWREEMQKRADATQSAGGSWSLTDDSYLCDVWALHKDIGKQLRANERPPIDLDRDATEYLTQQALIRRDKSFVEEFFTDGVWTRDLDSSGDYTAWDDGGSTPIQDLENEIIIQKKLTGKKPNKLVLGAEVWSVLKNHSDFIDRIKYSGGFGTNAVKFSTQALAALLELDEVVIASGVSTTTEKGDAAPEFSFIAGNNALLLYAAPRPSMLVPSAGYIFPWQGLNRLNGGGDGGAQSITKFEMKEIGADRIEIEMAYDMKVVAPDMGSFFKDAVDEIEA